MGGHAYSSYNNIHQKLNDFAVITTGGGDNIVLAQQAGKYLLRELRNEALVSRSKAVPETAESLDSIAYLETSLISLRFLTLEK